MSRTHENSFTTVPDGSTMPIEDGVFPEGAYDPTTGEDPHDRRHRKFAKAVGSATLAALILAGGCAAKEPGATSINDSPSGITSIEYTIGCTGEGTPGILYYDDQPEGSDLPDTLTAACFPFVGENTESDAVLLADVSTRVISAKEAQQTLPWSHGIDGETENVTVAGPRNETVHPENARVWVDGTTTDSEGNPAPLSVYSATDGGSTIEGDGISEVVVITLSNEATPSKKTIEQAILYAPDKSNDTGATTYQIDSQLPGQIFETE